MAMYFLGGEGKEKAKSVLRTDWQQLEKLLRDANENRNKLAHYGAEFELKDVQEQPDGSFTFEVTPDRLQPSPYNYVSRLEGKTSDKPEHNLGREEIERYIINFRTLAERLGKFNVNVSQLRA